MKTLLLLTVLFGAVLFITAEVDEVKPQPKEEVVEEKKVEPVAPEAVGEMDPSPEVRFFTCPTGWEPYKGGCYQFVSSSRSWSSAAYYCNSFGASLPSVHDLFEYSFLQSLTRRAGYSTAWTGGFYFQSWRWLDESTYSYQNWGTQYSTSYACIHVNANAAWSNTNCASSLGFICKTKTC
ncbi:ladderlectin-like [Cynoglossus semilaevis]|uniref:Ladderlectin-like n=1 Tax=Cynoglossus semilaevis TaxID=244447 RepID=A0A3P8US57_CYNSE|nr:ladderlectin-like [Cynoglossus semilaevis]